MANQQQYWQFEIFGTDPDLIGFYGPAGIILPSGNTGERPASPALGHMRFNTQINSFEGFDGSWVPFETGLVPTFDALADTPPSKVGSANRVMMVDSTETLIAYSTALTLENTGRLRVPAAYEALVDADTVITNKKYVNDQDNLQLSLSGGLMTGGITMGSNTITGLPLNPTTASEAASKSYVDQIASGIDFKESCHMGTVATFSSTYDNGTLGLGATLTATGPGVLPPAITDNHAHYSVGTRVLVKDQTDPVENGIYEITDTGTGEEVTEIVTIADVANSLDGAYFRFNDDTTSFYVWYDTPAGAGDPTPGGTGITVAIATAASAEDVKNATIAAINVSGAATVAYDDENNSFYLVNNVIGAVTNANPSTSGFTVTVAIDGIAGGTAWILTRATDADNSPSSEVSGGMFSFVEDGATLAGVGFVLVQPSDDAVLGTDPLIFSAISSGGGAFLPLSGGIMVGTITIGSAGIQIVGDTSTATAPTYSFDGDLDTGLHQTAGAGTLSLVLNAAATWNYSTTAITPAATATQDIGSTGLKMRDVYADHFLPNFGAVGDPSYSFEGATTTGMYNDGSGGIGFAVGGNDALSVESDGTVSVGTASYETLVLADNDVPNKKYVDDSIGAIPVNSIVDADGDTSVNVEAAADDDTIRFNTGATPVGFPLNTNTMTIASSGLVVALPAANVATTVGAPINLTAGDGNTTGDGGGVSLVSGAGGATGVGGVVSLIGAAGYSGGDISITAGESTDAAYRGGVQITGGANNTAAAYAQAGHVEIKGGAVTSANDNAESGVVHIQGGISSGAGSYGYNISTLTNVSTKWPNGGTVYSGSVVIEGGTSDRDEQAGGDIKIGGGDVTGSFSSGGAVDIIGGNATGQNGGGINIKGGVGSTGGGGVSLTSGNGTSSGDIFIQIGSSTTGVPGKIVAGAGNLSAGTQDGGDITFDAGDVTAAGTGDGGDIILTAGTSVAGSAGSVVLPDQTAPSVTTNKLYSVSGALNWNGIDLTAVNQYTEAFDDSDLTAGVLTVTHSLGRRYNHVTVYDNGAIIVQPDSVTATSTSVTTIDLTSFGTLTGTWNVVVS